MRTVIILVLLTACYTKKDAVEQVRAQGGPDPINCVSLNSGDAVTSFACTDGENVKWACDDDGCIRWGGR